jgi:hypothetical protein
MRQTEGGEIQREKNERQNIFDLYASEFFSTNFV